MKTRTSKSKPKRKTKSKRRAYLKAKRALDKDRSERNYLSNPDMTTSTVSWGIYEDIANRIMSEPKNNAFKDNLTYIGVLSLALLTLIVITSRLYSLLFG